MSGTQAFEQTIHSLDHNAKVKWHFEEGQQALKKQILCTIQGDLIQVLKAERVALNFLMHLTGIATLTHLYVQKMEGTHTKILDTRKTTPGYRELEKRAVVHGGGQNHRQNLSTAILLKDNHITLMGGIKPAVTRVRSHTKLPVQVEASNLEQVKECVALKVNHILLDNMDNEMMKKAVALIPKEIHTEASGNMNLERVASVAALGVNYISVGALTHSAPSADISLLFDWENA